MDRLENWKNFSKHMEEYIESETLKKYGRNGTDLMAITADPVIPVFNILKYALRIWNNQMRPFDLEKIGHYAEIAWTLSNGELIKPNRTMKEGSCSLKTSKS
jgi:hypothetical protein